MAIWYVYEKATGRFAGSGTPYIDTETHGSTDVPVPPEPPQMQSAWFFNPETQEWEGRHVVEGDEYWPFACTSMRRFLALCGTTSAPLLGRLIPTKAPPRVGVLSGSCTCTATTSSARTA